MFGDPEADRIYPLKALSEIGQILTGTTPSMKKTEYYDSNDIMFFKPGDIAEEKVTYLNSSINYISENARDVARIFPKGSVLVTCIGIIGKIGITNFEGSCNQQINVIIPNQNANSEFLAYSLYIIRNKIQEAANAPVVPILNKSDFSKLELPMPPIELQNTFAEFVKQVDKSKFIVQKQIEDLQELLDSKMDEYFG